MAVDIAFGEKVRIARSIGFRYSMPTDAPYLTPPHQDHFYIRETDEFRMIWIPLMDLEIDNGGLAIAAGSHRHGLQEHVEFDGVYSYFFKGRPQKGVRPEDIRGEWTSSRFEVGDLLMFHSCAVHRAIPNTSGLVRLSLNTITYPARRPTMWQAERTGAGTGSLPGAGEADLRRPGHRRRPLRRDPAHGLQAGGRSQSGTDREVGAAVS